MFWRNAHFGNYYCVYFYQKFYGALVLLEAILAVAVVEVVVLVVRS